MKVSEFEFGQTRSNQTVKGFLVSNKQGYSMKVINWGATLISFKAPDGNRNYEEITLGFDSFDLYEEKSPYFGSTVGRVTNRIAKGRFDVAGKTYQLEKNQAGVDHIHGGSKGLSKVIWDLESRKGDSEASIICSYLSKNGEEGYPGNMKIKVCFTLRESNEFVIEYKAETDQACPINLTNHTYWNLDGSMSNSILSHQLQLECDRYLSVDKSMIPTGEINLVSGSPWDYSRSKLIAQDIELVGGYDHCYLQKQNHSAEIPIATLFAPESGRRMRVFTTEPAVQLYTGNFLSDLEDQGFSNHDGLCLETQAYPDAPNHANFPSIILQPGMQYYQKTTHSFDNPNPLKT